MLLRANLPSGDCSGEHGLLIRSFGAPAIVLITLSMTLALRTSPVPLYSILPTQSYPWCKLRSSRHTERRISNAPIFPSHICVRFVSLRDAIYCSIDLAGWCCKTFFHIGRKFVLRRVTITDGRQNILLTLPLACHTHRCRPIQSDR